MRRLGRYPAENSKTYSEVSMIYRLRLTVAYVLLALVALALLPLVFIRPMHRNNMGDICIAAFEVFKRYWGITLDVEHPERLEPKQATVIIANHQSNEDLFFCMRLIRKGTVAMAKWELVYIPFIGAVFLLAGNIMVKREQRDKAKQALEKSAKKMTDKNLSLVIFPEGTRNYGKPLPFKLGAFKLAIEAQAPIQPVAFAWHSKTLNYNRFKSGVLKMHCMEPISTLGLTQDDAPELARRCQQLIEEETNRLTKLAPGYDGSLD